MLDQEFPQFPLAYPMGWQEILSSEEMAEYATEFQNLVASTQAHLHEPWVTNREEVQRRWQILLEDITITSISEEDRSEMTEAEVLETAFLTLRRNLEEMGWNEEGASLTVPAIFEIPEGMEALAEELDIRDPKPLPQ